MGGSPRPAAVRTLRQGVVLDDGPTAAARVALVEPDVLRITVREGRNRLVRRMCEKVGHPVQRLVRIRIGPLADRRLPPGHWRPLTVDEARSLEKAAAPEAGRAGDDPLGAPRGRGPSGRSAKQKAAGDDTPHRQAGRSRGLGEAGGPHR